MRDSLTIKPNGDIILSNVEILKDEMAQELDRAQLVLDMEKVKMIDSKGIGALLEINGAIKKRGGDLKLINVSASITKMFQIMRLDRHFNIIPGMD